MGRRRGPGALALVASMVLVLTGCLEHDVRVLSSDEMGGRDNGTPGSLAAQEHLIETLDDWGPGANTAATGDDAYRQPIEGGTNIVGLIPGTDLADEYVIVGGHYDGLGTDCDQLDPDDDICNGATDNATGAAAVLAVGRMLDAAPRPPRRTVVIALWDREEDGLRGARHWVADPLVPLESTVAYVNLDILGANLRGSVRDSTFAIGAETGGPDFRAAVDRAARSGRPLTTRQLSLAFGLGRSDHAVFAEHSIPTVFFGDSTGPCYHTTGDDVDVVDFDKLRLQTETARALVRDLSSGRVTPSFATDAPVSSYDDAVSLLGVLRDGIVELDTFSPEHQTTLLASLATVEGIVERGREAFSSSDMVDVLLAAAPLVDILTTGECDGFLPDTPRR